MDRPPDLVSALRGGGLRIRPNQALLPATEASTGSALDHSSLRVGLAGQGQGGRSADPALGQIWKLTN